MKSFFHFLIPKKGQKPVHKKSAKKKGQKKGQKRVKKGPFWLEKKNVLLWRKPPKPLLFHRNHIKKTFSAARGWQKSF